ncbi:MCE family protein [Nocardioides marinus]|uniref:Phospholipid/cholesterol/gamma-HCH transport system substrate-binding protein n=1 Tax=Nocardioides marinus TaxID=374514 RepID=A0A7Y9YAW2_9ACTN|nr:MCE family protein [Nocardioides marinus]NYI08796.1 phospholipid/cholesterol/gamma-HCH transport system substrate-binding protein [Nocardioides marinus]
MRRTTLRRTRLALGLLAASLTLSACDFDVYSLPLPGGPDTGDDPITVTAQFADVLDLVPKSTVKVNDVTVGKITDVDLDGYTALVTMELQNDVDLPDDAVARLRQTSLLGEKFVELDAPADGGNAERLGDGDLIQLEQTGRNPEVEEVLGALSLVLNGGGVAQLKTIASELNNALEGREDSARSVLQQLDVFTETLDDNKADIVDAIERLNQLAISVRQQQGTIDDALDELPSALRSLDAQREDLVTMLESLNELGDVGVRVIEQSKDTTIETIRQLQPVLTELANSGDAFVKAFNVALTYPFVDEVVGRDPQVARNLHMGDFTNLSVQLEVDLSLGVTGVPTGLPTLLPTELEPTAVVGAVLNCLSSADLTSKACQKVLGSVELLLQLKEECAKPKNEDVVVCSLLNQVPGLPDLPGLGGIELPILGDLFGGTSGQGLPRTAPGGAAQPQGPRVSQLTSLYDADLVGLMIPGMVVS